MGRQWFTACFSGKTWIAPEFDGRRSRFLALQASSAHREAVFASGCAGRNRPAITMTVPKTAERQPHEASRTFLGTEVRCAQHDAGRPIAEYARLLTPQNKPFWLALHGATVAANTSGVSKSPRCQLKPQSALECRTGSRTNNSPPPN